LNALYIYCRHFYLDLFHVSENYEVIIFPLTDTNVSGLR
jgi:hypothetical protein